MTDEELALVTRLEGYRTTCCDDSRAVPDLIAIIRRQESEVAALKESIRERERKAFEAARETCCHYVENIPAGLEEKYPTFAEWEREKTE